MVEELRVQELTARDAGHGIVRLSRTAMKNLEITAGEIVQITGRRRTVAKAVLSYADDPDDVIGMDGNLRANANVGINDRVEVVKADVNPAKSITVALPQYVMLRGAEPFLKRHLVDRPVVRGDSVHMHLLGRPVVFLVTRTAPSGPVTITDRTTVTTRDAPITEEDLRGERTEIPDMTYEDYSSALDRTRRRSYSWMRSMRSRRSGVSRLTHASPNASSHNF